MSDPASKFDDRKAACLQAAATVWAAGKLGMHYSQDTPETIAKGIIDFTTKLYKAWNDAPF